MPDPVPVTPYPRAIDGAAPPADQVTEADQYDYLGRKQEQMPGLGTCRCDAAPYMHLGFNVEEGDAPIRLCFVVRGQGEGTITILRGEGGNASRDGAAGAPGR